MTSQPQGHTALPRPSSHYLFDKDGMSPTIRIAISGGGVAGASLLHALLKYPHLDVHIFESASTFREAGVAFGYTRNATAAMSLTDPSMMQCLENAGGVPLEGARFFLSRGAGTGKMVFEADNKKMGKASTTIVQRANLLREFLADTPEERMHASKKLIDIKRQTDGSLLLAFADGSTHECDILVGADGIRSFVRTHILGKGDPAAMARNSGMWAIMTLNPYEKARASMNDELVNKNDAREYGWVGNGTFMLHNILSRGTVVQFSVTGYDEDAVGSAKWQKMMSREQIRDKFIDQNDPSHMDKAVAELLCDEPERGAIYLWEHLPAKTYNAGPVCVMGDAAHATVPFQASGGGMCVEDTLILSTLLGRSKSRTEAITALKVYDQVRRPRTQDIVKSSLITGFMLMGIDPNAGTDPDKLATALGPRWDFILDFDNERHRDEAIKLMDAELKA